MTSFLTILGKGAVLSQDALGAWILLASVGLTGPRTLAYPTCLINLSCGNRPIPASQGPTSTLGLPQSSCSVNRASLDPNPLGLAAQVSLF